MKKKVTREIEVDICDNCTKESGMAYNCQVCGYCSCLQCEDTVLVTFTFGVHVCGWADGYYCKPCDAKLAETKSDPLHNAYVEVWRLKEELKRWSVDFEARRKVAEAQVETLFKASRAE